MSEDIRHFGWTAYQLSSLVDSRWGSISDDIWDLKWGYISEDIRELRGCA